jgi:molecular chaperone DnaK
MAADRAIGIDLGTTHTVVAVATPEGHTEILRTKEGETLIPSVVLLADDRTIVGREAQLRGRLHPERMAACAKQQLGQAFYDQRIGGERFPPEAIEACILQAVQREWFADQRGKCGAVIAVPAYFNEAQRHAVATAAEMSGLALLDLVNEPVAAALAFAEHTPTLSGELPLPPTVTGHRLEPQPHFVLVYDLGGYTFEASVLRISPGRVEMIASEHDAHLGGHDWDLRLADFLAEPFIRQQGRDPREAPHDLDQLLQRAAQVKLALGVRGQTSLRLELRGQSEKTSLTREQFEGMTADLVERTVQIAENALRQAQLRWRDLRSVLLVGGATRMPMIRRRLTELAGRPPDDRVSPDEAVARGAALYATAVRQGRGAPALQVTSVSTHSLGIEGSDLRSGRRVNKILIHKGTPLPATATREFVSSANASRTIVFNILEGDDRQPSKCVKIGRVMIGDLPTDVAEQWPVEVTYSYSASGRLTVDARVRYTDRQVHLETARPGGVSQFHISRWKEAISQGGLAAFRQVRAWERAADAAPPLVLAGVELASAAEPEPAGGLLSFLQRAMPFVFRRNAETAQSPKTPVPQEQAS